MQIKVLKDYQKNTLGVVRDFFEKAQSMSATDAYFAATKQADIQGRLGKFRKYVEVGGAVKVPTVAVKVPTGGGKTIIAVEAIKIIGEAFGRGAPFVLWFTPSDTICRQTVEALKNHTHPYRQTLDAVFGGKVRVFGIDEKFMITPSDRTDNVCIVVTTAQAFVHQAHEKYNVYKNNENLMDHFEGVQIEDGMEAMEDDPSKPKCSFANLIIRLHPIMIVDEAHRFMAKLSKETLEGLKPCGVLELTATPTVDNNLVYNVRATELFDEEMVKLPIDLVPYTANWTQCVLAALAKRSELEKIAAQAVASGDGDYLRPILLLQATKVDGDVPIATLKKFLVETANIPAGEIAVVTGEQKELDGIDLNDPACPIRYVITVEALKEGWDCPSAYVLCSVANVHSNTATVQLLGRVMRQPQAKRRKTAALNRAYAYVMSPSFHAAAEDLVTGLKERGFDSDEAFAAILLKPGPNVDALPLYQNVDRVVLTADEASTVEVTLPKGANVKPLADGTFALEVPDRAPQGVQVAIVASLSNAGLVEKAQEFAVKVQKKKARQNDSAPSKHESFRLPKICGVVQGELVFDADGAYGLLEVDVRSHLPPALTPDDFKLGNVTTQGFEITLKGDAMVFKPSENAAQAYLPGLKSVLDEAGIVNSLDAITITHYLKQLDKRAWITGIVHELVQVRGYSPDQIYNCRYQLKRILMEKLEEASASAKQTAYQKVFDFSQTEIPLKLDFNEPFEFTDRLYEDDLPFMKCYGGGSYQFVKHFLGPNRIPDFDGAQDGEEYQCARTIDSHPKVKFWLRNAAKKTGSFRLPLADEWFYPDFVGMLTDGRLFVIEYKGEHLRTNADTIAKDAIGRLWAQQDKNCLYQTIFKTDGGLDLSRQLDKVFL